MNEQLAIYLWSITENVKFTLFIMFISEILFGLFVIIAGFISDENLNDKIGVGLIIVGILCGIILPFIPPKQDLALILLYPKVKQGTIEMVQSDTAKKMKTVLDSYLDKQIKELQQ